MTNVAVRRIGNYKPGPGRPPGRKNNRTLQLEEAARQAAAAFGHAFEGDAHAFLMAIYKNGSLPLEIRILAASRALRVEKPLLSTSHNRVDISVGLSERLEAARKRVAALRNDRHRDPSGLLIEGKALPSFMDDDV